MSKTIQLHGKYASGQHEQALVSDEDFEDLAQFRWIAKAGGGKAKGHVYAVRTWREDGLKRFELMHRRIIGALPGQEVDHINRQTCDNRRSNIRIVSHRVNMLNKEMLSVSLTCKHCGKATTYQTIAGSVKRKFCGLECRSEHDRQRALARYYAKKASV